MADAGLFIGWGAPVRGREAKGLVVFNDARRWYEDQQSAGAIESFELALLGPHGGDLYGFFLLRGSEDQIDALRRDEEFQRLHTRAGLIVERLGIVPILLEAGLGRALGLYQEAVVELAG
jgi:hypothetical protein